MRILAIRGRNLASLGSAFAVDFQSEPLASAGLFAIIGPTGAGKSTLLDALCLALYEKTPRLTRATGKGEVPDVGDAAVTPSDPRTLLRRGAAEGYAEVDYTGIDGVSYSARWSVRRARGKADGKLQQTEISLKRLSDGQVLGDHRKTETLKAIEASIGLNFEQFTRAVLLAQNDFAAFLKASDDDRAELLQTLTGTATFTRISVRAFERMKQEREALERLQSQLQDQAPLTPEARQTKEAEVQALTAQQQAHVQRKAVLDGQLQWFERQAQLQQQCVVQLRRRDEAQAALHDAGPRDRRLQRIDGVQGARQPFADWQRSAKAIPEAADSQARLVRQLEMVMRDAQANLGRDEAMRKALEGAETRRHDAQAGLDRARALDERVDVLTPQRDAAASALATAQRLQAEAEGRRLQAQQQAGDAGRQRDGALAWLQANAVHRALAESWPRWEAYLGHAAKLATEQQAIRATQQQRGTALKELVTQLQAAAQAVAEQQAGFQAAQNALVVAGEAIKASDPESLTRQKSTLEAQRAQTASAALCWQTLAELKPLKLTLDKRRASEQETRTRAERSLRAARAAMPVAEQALAGAVSALELGQRIASETAEQLRATLRADVACPVCGALDHPYAGNAQQVDAMLAGFQREMQARQKARDAVYRETVDAEVSFNKAGEQIQLLDRDLASTTERLAKQQAEWQALALHHVRNVAEPELAAWFEATQQTIQAGLQQVQQAETAFHEALRRRDAAQQQADRFAVALAEAQTRHVRLDQALRAAQQAQDEGGKRFTELTAELDAQLTQLDAAFSEEGWRDRWLHDPAAFAHECVQTVHAWQAQQRLAVDAEARLANLKVALEAATTAAGLAAQHAAQQLEGRDRHEVALQAAVVERRQLFEGQPVAAVAKAFEEAVGGARDRLAQAQQATQKAQAEQVRASEALKQGEAQLRKLQADHATASEALQRWIDAFNAQALFEDDAVDFAVEHAGASDAGGYGGTIPDSKLDSLTAESLAALLRYEPAWVATERGALQQLASQLAQAQAVLDEQLKAGRVHEAARPTDATPESLREALTQLGDEATRTADALAAARHVLQADSERLAHSAKLREDIDRQAGRSRVWAQLGELIGSADGKKFRNFAQQLTLDVLLGYANRHLESLSRRYRLERITDSLGLLVVDQDMGDEIRSVHSLSGGESFLVSLALALALASLSSHRVRVESLFIDEGFGTLDSESLAVAMEALDSLQAQGRKVGVISHVQDMTERIGTRIRVRRMAGGLSRVDVE